MRSAGESGSVLVEALVAVLIVAAMAGLWFQTLGQGARQQRHLADRRTAMLVAQSQMATVGVITAIAPGETTGSDAGMDWRITVDPWRDGGEGIEKVTVSAGRPAGRELATLQSLRLGQ